MNIQEKYIRYHKGQYVKIKNKIEHKFLNEKFTEEQLLLFNQINRQEKITNDALQIICIIFGFILGALIVAGYYEILISIKTALGM